MYDIIADHARRDPESVQWAAYGFENPDEPDIHDEFFFSEGPNLLESLERED